MTSHTAPRGLGLAEALERAAGELGSDAEAIRPANGNPYRLLDQLDAEGAARVLDWLLRNELEAASELAETWSAECGDAGAAPLLRIREEGLPKPARKLLRRVRHRLRSRGVEVPGVAPAPVVATLPPVEDEVSEALLSPIDPRGVSAVYLAESHPSGGVRLFELMLDEARGLLSFEVYSTGRSRVRRFLREFTHRERFRAVKAPPESVRALVRRVAAAQPADRPLPRGFSEWRSRVAECDEGTPTPGELARTALGDGAEEEAFERALELVRRHEQGPWPPDSERLQATAGKIAEIAKSQLVVSAARRHEQARQVMDEALEELFAEPLGEQMAARFETAAYVCWKSGREDDARACLRAATAFRETAPEDNPLARALLEIWLGPVLSELGDESEGVEGESLLVKP